MFWKQKSYWNGIRVGWKNVDGNGEKEKHWDTNKTQQQSIALNAG